MMFCTDTFCLSKASVTVTVITLFPAVRVTGTVVTNTPPAPMVVVTGAPLSVTVTVWTVPSAGGVAVPVMVVVAVLTSAGVVTAISVAVVSRVIFRITVLFLSAASVVVIVITLFPAARVTGMENTPPAPTIAVTGARLLTVADIELAGFSPEITVPTIAVVAVLTSGGVVTTIIDAVVSSVM